MDPKDYENIIFDRVVDSALMGWGHEYLFLAELSVVSEDAMYECLRCLHDVAGWPRLP